MMSGRSTGASRMHSRIRTPGSIRNAAANRTEAEMEALWQKLESAITDIHHCRSSLHRFEDLHGLVYSITVKRHGKFLYNKIRSREIEWFHESLLPRLRLAMAPNIEAYIFEGVGSLNERRQHGQDLLLAVRDLWNEHQHAMSMIADVCMYLDRNYSQANHEPSIFESTIAIFRDYILKAPLADDNALTVQALLIGAILSQIEMERNGEIINRAAIKGCVGLLCGLVLDERTKDSQRLYEVLLEPDVIRQSREFYTAEREKLLSNGSTPEWVATCFRRLREENERCRIYLLESTLEGLTHIVHDELIRAPFKEFTGMASSGLSSMIDSRSFDDIRNLYQLELLVNPSTPEFNAALRAKVVARGSMIEKTLIEPEVSAAPAKADGDDSAKQTAQSVAAQQTATAMIWVNKILDLDQDFAEIISKCCSGALHVEAAVSKGFSDFINRFARSAEFVSLFIDETLRRIARGKEEADVETVLNRMIKVVRFIEQKDLFERYYQKHLARRLMSTKSEDSDAEKLMISRMKQEFGNNYTHKFENMLRDLELSAELTSAYRQRTAADPENAPIVEVSIAVLSNGAWPTDFIGQGKTGDSQLESLVWPASLAPAIDSISQFYLGRHNGRKLTWVGSLGSADVVCTFPAIPGKKGPLARQRRYEVNMTVYGVLVVDLFNDVPHGTTRSIEEIQAATAIPMAELVRTLMALAVAPKCRVLLKTPATKSVKPGDRFEFNTEFVSKTIRIKAPVVTAAAKLENDAQRRETERKNEESRSHLIDAAVVRIMKQRKELVHSSLITEVIKQMSARFNPDVSLVKRRIEDLLARDYIERVEDADVPTYRYLA